MSIKSDYLAMTPGSKAWADRAKALLPDGVTADTRLFDPYGLYIKQAKGVNKVDVDGNEYLDFFGGHGALVLGHGHPQVTAAVIEAYERGIQYAACHPLEVLWAEKIVDAFPSIEIVRFTGSGTEATLLALRMARAFTGRSKILRIATHYHGWHDFCASGYNSNFDGTPAPGVLREIADNTLLVRPDDFEGLNDVFTKHGSDIAVFIAEPVGSHFGLTPVSDDFLVRAASLAHLSGALFILDEVISGFRVGDGGMQKLLGLKPDLTTLGKASAGGLPGGIVGGRAEVMAVLEKSSSKKVLHQGTFTGNPMTAAAALAAIKVIQTEPVSEHINRLGDLARQQLNALFLRRNLDWLAYGRFSAVHLWPGLSPNADTSSITAGTAPKVNPTMVAALRMGLILEGMDIGGRGSVFIGYQHTEAHVDTLVAAFDLVLNRLHDEGHLA